MIFVFSTQYTRRRALIITASFPKSLSGCRSQFPYLIDFICCSTFCCNECRSFNDFFSFFLLKGWEGVNIYFMGSRDLRLTYIDHDAREVVINLVFPLNSFSLSTQVYAYYFIVLLLITLKRNNDYKSKIMVNT